MERTLKGNTRITVHLATIRLLKGSKWGLLGGLAGTMVMDILLMGALWAVGQPALLCFSIVGDTVARSFSLLGVQMAGGVLTGAAAHYLIGPLVGVIFGTAMSMIPALRQATLKKSLIAAIIYVEILSQPILATTPILLKMTPSATLLWYAGSFLMHLVLALVLGLIVGYGLRPAPQFKGG